MLMKPLVDTATSPVCEAYDVRAPTRSSNPMVGHRSRGPSVRRDASHIRAGAGVLAAGSFAYNDAMVAQYAPRIAGRPPPRSNSTTGAIGWRKHSAPTWRTWTPPRWHS